MDAGFTAEQEEIRRTLRELLHKRCGPQELRAALDTPAGHDPALWTALADRLGLPGLAVPEEYGGVGCSATELALAAEETGRALAPSPSSPPPSWPPPDPRARHKGPAGLAPASHHHRRPHGHARGPRHRARHRPRPDRRQRRGVGGRRTRRGRAGAARGEGWRLYGQAEQVLDGHSAGLLLVAAHTGGFARSRTLLFLVPGDADGVVRTRQTALDATRSQARVQLRDVEAELLGEDGADVLGALARAGDTAASVLACEAVGAANRALERTVGYVRQREQFGRPIGSFQAVKHRLADVYVQLQAARSAAYYAAWSTAHDEHVGPLALAQALEALRTVAAEAVQLHGGIGFTWEHEAHLYFKRAAGDDLLFGPVHRLRAHAAEGAGLFEGREVAV